MRNLILFGPFMWFRRVVLWLFLVLLLLVLVLYLVANSPMAIRKAVDTFAPDYNITYESIKGNALTGFRIQNPQYNYQSIAKEIVLKWNPNTLANKQISISKVDLKEANIDVIKALADAFGSEKNTSKAEEINSSEPFGFIVDVNDIALSLLPFEMEGIEVASAMLHADSLEYKEGNIDIEALQLNIESNLSKIAVEGSYHNRIVQLETLELLDSNISALQGLLVSDDNTSSPTEDRHATNSSTLTPLRVEIAHTLLSILPYTYDPVTIQTAKLKLDEMVYEVKTKIVKQAILDLNASTNLSKIQYQGKMKENQLLGKIVLKPQAQLYTLYDIPLRKEAIGEIEVDFNASTQEVSADVFAKGKQILEGKKGDFNVDINRLTSHVTYEINSSVLHAKTHANLSTPYTKEIKVSNILSLDDGLKHEGTIEIKKLEGIEGNVTKLLGNLEIAYNGDAKGIETTFQSDSIKGYFNTDDFVHADTQIESIGTVALAPLVTLPDDLQAAKAQIQINAPLNLKDLSVIDANVSVVSNLVNIDAKVRYAEEIVVDGTAIIPEDSLIKNYSQDVVWENLSPMAIQVRLKGKALAVDLDSKSIKSKLAYGLDSGRLNGTLDVAGQSIGIKGNTKEKLSIDTKITSLKHLTKSINTIYPVGELPPFTGTMDVALNVNQIKSATLHIKAPKLVYQADKTTKHTLKDVQLLASMEGNKIQLNSYQVVFKKQKYFSTKVANIVLGDTIVIDNVWINDTLKIEGEYTPKNAQGAFSAKAKSFHIKEKIADVYVGIDTQVKLDGNDTRIDGKVVIQKGKITPQLEGRSFATDSDIIFIQALQEKKKSAFMDNLTLMLRIETKQALTLKQPALRIKLKPDLTISKDKGGELLYLGSVDLPKGGSYVFQEKKFVLAKSAVYFTGDVNKPLLDIKAKYKSLNHLITIAVNGTPTEPIIHFSSSPSLSREQILSVILFDTEAGGDTHTGNEMMRMMGGAMAKAALSDVGVKVDHFAIGEGNSIEVGKKLNAKTMLIYINGEIPKVKLKYQHGTHTESVFGVSEESQSYDIIYKTDF